MSKPKLPYQVYTSYCFVNGDYPEDSHQDEWRHEGETWAVSEKQAINNVRHRNYGDNYSQYGAWLDWIAIQSNGPLSPIEIDAWLHK